MKQFPLTQLDYIRNDRRSAYHTGHWICMGVTDDYGDWTDIFKLPPGAYTERYIFFHGGQEHDV